MHPISGEICGEEYIVFFFLMHAEMFKPFKSHDLYSPKLP